MKSNLEHAVESFFLELYRAHPALKGKKLRHFDEDRPAETDCIVVEATQGNHRQDGPKGYDVEVTATYRSPAKVTPQQSNLVAGAMSDAVFQARPRMPLPSQSLFHPNGVLMLMDDLTGSRDNTKSLRRREKKFNLIARLNTEPENAFSR
jgi:hypothetical protein